jgi:hypothetical protein
VRTEKHWLKLADYTPPAGGFEGGAQIYPRPGAHRNRAHVKMSFASMPAAKAIRGRLPRAFNSA